MKCPNCNGTGYNPGVEYPSYDGCGPVSSCDACGGSGAGDAPYETNEDSPCPVCGASSASFVEVRHGFDLQAEFEVTSCTNCDYKAESSSGWYFPPGSG